MLNHAYSYTVRYFPHNPKPLPKFTRVQQKSSAIRCADWLGIYKYIEY